MPYPVFVLLIGLLTVLGMILVLRVNAFLALISAAMLVSLLSPGELPEKMTRVAEAFGRAAGSIGIVIALAAVIGKCLMDSGAADRIVRCLLRALGEKRAPTALAAGGYILGVPVFFDTVFYLLIPLARSLWKSTGQNYVLYALAIAVGGVVTHTMVPPTPGPLFMASELGIDLGMMILVGALIAILTAAVGLVGARFLSRMVDIPMRPLDGVPEPEPLADDQLPPLWLALLPVVLPVILISLNTASQAWVGSVVDHGAGAYEGAWRRLADVAAVTGNPNLALLLAAVAALVMLARQRRLTLPQLARSTETALMSGGLIILITAGGGAFGAMLRQTGIESTLRDAFADGGRGAGMTLLLLGFGVSALLKVAQGSGTVCMMVASSIMVSLGATPELLGCHPVYLATAIGSGSVVGSWMNDSGFWIFARMSGLTELEALKTWTLQLALLGLTSLALTLLLAWLMPLV
ncbi:MAG: GntP family permease [Thermoguttaceae bacterium]|jgi:GntP family gluconate:H+ symporter|nr:GntP family permease [Thermoguttaceae bacterium]